MLQDAIIDLSNRGEVILDPFLGSGSTLIAAENTGRVCCGIELDPLYVDVIIRRYQTVTDKIAVSCKRLPSPSKGRGQAAHDVGNEG